MNNDEVPGYSPLNLLCISAMLIAVLVVVIGCASETPDVLATATPRPTSTPDPMSRLHYRDCYQQEFIDEIVQMSQGSKTSTGTEYRVVRIYSDSIEEVERKTRSLRCEAEFKFEFAMESDELPLVEYYDTEYYVDGSSIGYETVQRLPSRGGTFDRPFAKDEFITSFGDIQISIVEVVADAWPIISQNQSNNPPAQGNRFLMVQVEIFNSSEAVSADLDDDTFYLIGNRQVVYSQSCGIIPNKFKLGISEIFPGGRVEANVCFEIPESERGLILIHQRSENKESRSFLRLTD